MSKPWVHALSSAKRFGGEPNDYMPYHEFLDSSKATIADQRHRALTHNAWFISFVMPRVFGDVFTNSEGKVVSVRDVCEQHVLEDFGGQFIPSAQDFLCEMSMQDWMNNGHGTPPSFARVAEKHRKKFTIID